MGMKIGLVSGSAARVDVPQTLLPGMTTEVVFRGLSAAAGAMGSAYSVSSPTPGVLTITWSRNRFRTGGLAGVAMMDRTKTVTVVSADTPEGARVSIAGETSSELAPFFEEFLAEHARR